MEVSKLTLSPELKHQTSTRTQILKWMQSNPNLCKHTNLKRMARLMRDINATSDSLRNELSKMVANQLIARVGTKFDSSFAINYSHRDIPSDVLETAPQAERERVAEIKAGLKDNQYIASTGTVVTKPKQTQTPQVNVEASKTDNSITITVNINLNGLN